MKIRLYRMKAHMQSALELDSIAKIFKNQLSILFCAKEHLIGQLPVLISHASFTILEKALEEDLEDTQFQIAALNSIFQQLDAQPEKENCLAMNKIIEEAKHQIVFNADNRFESDMSILFYMGVIENLQVGAGRILSRIAALPAYLKYAQQVAESLDLSKENARLFLHIAEEYLQLA